jgi:hypothetical protein
MPTPDQSPAPVAPAPPAPPAPPALPVAQTQVGVPPTLEGLNAQLSGLNVQYAALRAQWNGLRTQLDQMLQTNPARPGVQGKWADVGIQMAQVRGDMARVQAQIAQVQGQPIPGVPSMPPFMPRRGPDPDMVVGVSFVLMLAVILPTSIAYARRIWRGKPAAPTRPMDDVSAQRLERLEHSVDAIAIEIERISEGQRFVTKVLAERPVAQPVAQSAASPSMAAGGGSDTPQVRALGAGPMEPIRLAERQAVKQTVKPN